VLFNSISCQNDPYKLCLFRFRNNSHFALDRRESHDTLRLISSSSAQAAGGYREFHPFVEVRSLVCRAVAHGRYKILKRIVGGISLVPTVLTLASFIVSQAQNAGDLGGNGQPALSNPLKVALLKWYKANPVPTTFPVGSQPYGVAFDGANIWVANFADNTVSKLKANDGTLLGTFAGRSRAVWRHLRWGEYLGLEPRQQQRRQTASQRRQTLGSVSRAFAGVDGF